jgi:methyl-accepting chemotaxis protein
MAFLQARRLERNGAAEQGTERAERLHDSLAAVTALLVQLQQVAAAAEEQSALAEIISESVTRVRRIREQSATASEQTAAPSAELARLGVEL